MQTNAHECGLYAIANATALAFGREHEHLIKCLENRYSEPFSKYKDTGYLHDGRANKDSYPHDSTNTNTLC